jgi:hypothetical protein
MMPPGEAMAKLEGCEGREVVEDDRPERRSESPSGVGPVLVWQQPHPIYLAELVYGGHKEGSKATLERYKDIVFETADYMATFVDYDPQRKEYVLGPGINSADEKHTDLAHNLNPTMELAYWKWALETAQQWRVRLGLAAGCALGQCDQITLPAHGAQWHLSGDGIPVENSRPVHDDLYVWRAARRGIDKDAMRNTLHRVAHPDEVQTAITWGTAMEAMCAARLGTSRRRRLDCWSGGIVRTRSVRRATPSAGRSRRRCICPRTAVGSRPWR